MPERLDKGMSYTVVAQGISMGMQFALSVLLARGLGADQYGLFGVFQNGVITVSSILDLGGNSAATKYLAETDALQDSKGSFSFLTSILAMHGLVTLVFWTVLLFGANLMIKTWFDGDVFLYAMFGFSVPVMIFVNDLVGALFGLRELKTVAIRIIVQNVLITGLSALLIWRLHYGVRIASLVYGGVMFVMLALVFWLLVPIIREKRLLPNVNLFLKKVFLFSIPIGGLFILDISIRYAPVFLVKALGVSNPSVNSEVANLSLAILLGGIAEGVLLMAIRSGFGFMGNWLAQKKLGLVLSFVAIFAVAIFLIYGTIAISMRSWRRLFYILDMEEEFLTAKSLYPADFDR